MTSTSAAVDPRTPVVVGAGAHNNHDGDAEPVAMMTASGEAAIADAGGHLRSHIQSVRAIRGIWPYRNPAGLVADRLGLRDVETAINQIGGNEVYDTFAVTCAQIASGELDAALICSAETMRTRRRDKAAGRRSDYLQEADAAGPDVTLGVDRPMATEQEMAAGMGPAVNFYAAVEVAIRHRLGEALPDHIQRIAGLWAGASEVAEANPHAWMRDPKTAAQIAMAGPDNRMVAAPYPKLMTSNINVDQAAAVVVCSAATAEAAGVPRDRWVFPLACTGAADALHMSSRRSLDDSPAMRGAGRRVLALAGVDTDDVGLIDLYSCFPAAVQLAQDHLGIDPARPFTITGGLTFAGGPLNSYCMHALARAVELLRGGAEKLALLTGNGGFFTKHSFVVLGGEPPANAFLSERVDVASQIDERPSPADPVQAGTIETYTATYDRDGVPDLAIVSVLDSAGARTWANSSDIDMIQTLLSADCVGATVRVAHESPVPTVELAD